MPLWGRSPSEKNKQRPAQEQEEAEATRLALEAGGLPLKARRRLREEIEAGHPLFTSDLSANELLLIRQQGYQPLSLVMGSSIYHVGQQYTIKNSFIGKYSGKPILEELTTLSEAHQAAAQLALSRLRQEAVLLNAHGVIGVRFTRRCYEWGRNLLEYTAIGTAVKLAQKPPGARPFLSDLSGQDFWKLLQAGYYPAGVVTGYCSYHVALGSTLGLRILNMWAMGANNQEIAPFAQGISIARQLAMRRAAYMAHDADARGIVGMQVEMEREIVEYETEEPKTKSLDLTVHFAAIGTAIRTLKKDQRIPAPQSTLILTDLRPGYYKQDRELTFNE